MAQDQDFLYEKAPLIEVIAEIHWALKNLGSIQTSKIDPYYDLFRESFLKAVGEAGFKHTEELIPKAVPIELVSDQPQIRFRQKANNWPLVQVGPGVLTVNIVPPYNGWSEFSPFLAKMVELLFKCYPLPEKTLRIERLHLRYIDGFDESFGFQDFSTFAESKLGFRMPLSEKFITDTVLPDSETSYILEHRFVNKSPKNSNGTIKLSPAEMNGRKAAILELHCESRFSDTSATQTEFITEWFDLTHQNLRTQFENLATPELKKIMGPRKEIE